METIEPRVIPGKNEMLEVMKHRIKQLEEPVVTRKMIGAAFDVLIKREVILSYSMLETLYIAMHIARLEGLK